MVMDNLYIPPQIRKKFEGVQLMPEGHLYRTIHNNVLTVHPSLGHFYEFANRHKDLDGASCKSSDNAWSGTKNFEAAFKLATEGWHDGLQKLDYRESRFSLPTELLPKYDMAYDTSGSYVDVDAYLQGTPECMVDFADMNVSSKVITIFINCSANCTVDPQDMIRMGRKIMYVIDALEMQKTRANIMIGEYTNQSKSDAITLIHAKQAGEPLNLQQLNFAIAHPSFLRRIMFAHNESHASAIRQAHGFCSGGGYGRPQSIQALLDDDDNDSFVVGVNERDDHLKLLYALAGLDYNKVSKELRKI